jgi:integrase
VYGKWCTDRGLDPPTTSAPQVADFLCDLFHEKRLLATTLSGYLAAILSIHTGAPDGSSLRQDRALKLLIEGFNNSNPPPRRVWPDWNLDIVLEALCKPPYEPALASTLRAFTLKTVFLLALTSGRRASEIQALAIDDYIVWHPSDGGVTLHFRPSFLAKNERSDFSVKPITLSRLDKTAGDRRLCCPVRAIKWYLKKSELMRGNHKQLFITAAKPNRPAAKATISNWVREVIVKSEAVTGQGRPRAHSTRSKAVSVAFQKGLSIAEIVETVCWRTEDVFIRKYLKDRPPTSAAKKFARTVLEGSSRR